MSTQPESVTWPTMPSLPPPPWVDRVLLIAERDSLENVPDGVEVIWLKPGKPMPLVVQR